MSFSGSSSGLQPMVGAAVLCLLQLTAVGAAYTRKTNSTSSPYPFHNGTSSLYPFNNVTSSPYSLKTDFTSSPTAFFDSFSFFTGPDPTQGFVQYLSRDAAAQAGLIGYVSSPLTSALAPSAGPPSVFIAADSTQQTPSGRPSVRLSSTATFGPGTLLIADIAHAPTACGAWPALWMLGGGQWPAGGEIDIFEVVNGGAANSVTLHTGPGCAVRNASAAAPFAGTMLTANCDVAAPGQAVNQGCQVLAPPGVASAGAPFNAAGGGVYATEWTPDGIAVWFFARAAAASWPPTLLAAAPDPRTFGAPLARFAGPGCGFATSFADMQVVLDTTFCGAWAGAVWASGGCAAATGASSCEEWVGYHPEAMAEVYWEIRGLRVYSSAAGVKKMARNFVA